MYYEKITIVMEEFLFTNKLQWISLNYIRTSHSKGIMHLYNNNNNTIINSYNNLIKITSKVKINIDKNKLCLLVGSWVS